MGRYVVNDRTNDDDGDHEVHIDTCHLYPRIASYTELGNHSECQTAVTKAKLTYPNSNGCIHCSEPCHTG